MSETATAYQPSDAALEQLRMDLGFLQPDPQRKTFLERLLRLAAGEIQRRGVKLSNGDYDDDGFVASWAAWKYRKRDAGDALPPMLREELHSRLVRQSMKGASG